VKVLLRRAALVPGAGADAAEQPLAVGDLVLDPLRLSVAWRGTPVPLTVTEFLLLSALVRRPGIVKTRDQLMTDAYPDRVAVSDRTIDSHVKRIRRKFVAVDPGFAAIEGVYGAGYRYALPPA
jgi:two-component system response regulator ChvI